MITGFKEKEYNSGFSLTIIIKVLKELKPLKKYVILLFIFSLCAALLENALPLLNKYAFDNYLDKPIDNNNLIMFCIIYLSIGILQPISYYLMFDNAANLESKYGANLRTKLYKKLMTLSFNYYDNNPMGWILSRVTSDISGIAEIVSWALFDIFVSLLTVLFSTIVLFMTDFKLALIFIVLLPIFVYLTKVFQERILKIHRESRNVNSRITGGFAEGINGAKTSKTLAIENQNLSEFKKETSNMYKVQMRGSKLMSLYKPFTLSFSGIAIGIILWIIGERVFNNTYPIGTLILFCQYGLLYFEPLAQLGSQLSEIQMVQANAERVFSVLDEIPSIKDSDEVIKKYGNILNENTNIYDKIIGKIEFKNISFSYNDKEIVLDNFNLIVNPKETIAIVGATGGGKSTIINLISRFYEPTKGQILIDDIDYKERSIGWLHSQLGYVLQTPHLFSGSIYENIIYGSNCSKEEVIKVCKLLNAHEFIMKLENDYDFIVGEGGDFLSLGQKQILSFARALIRNPNIVILDEATSSIDTESESLIQNATDKLIKDKTTIIVAHRLSTIVKADKIIVIDKGKIVECGNHNELMKLKKEYYRLYTNQFNDIKQKEILGDINETKI